ncbi:MAG: prolyl oligopeptidase family serine peptidase [bacterium]|nr:prolyl oligopeptidase family serine peptidase [bacterium]
MSAIATVSILTALICVAASPEELERQAVEAMKAGKYEEAANLYEEALTKGPGQPRTLYNLACCHAHVGDLEQAATRLEEAWDAGFLDLELINTDPDLEALRASRKGRALIKRLNSKDSEIRQLMGRPEFFDAPVLGGMRIVTPMPFEEKQKYPLVVALHGHGGDSENMVGIFNRTSTSLSAVICAPYGPHPIPFDKGHGYSWYPAPWLYREVLRTGGPLSDRQIRQESFEDHEQEIGIRYVLAAIDAMKDRYPIDDKRIFLLGHSEGGVLAYGLAIKHPDLFRGLIVVGSRLRDRDATPELLAAAAGRLQVRIYHSHEDEAIDFAHATKAHEALSAKGVDSKVVVYRGGHSLTVELVRDAARWITARGKSKKPN